MSSGVAVNPEVMSTWEEMKIGKKHKFAILGMNDDMTEIVVQKTGSESTYDDFIGNIQKDSCCFALYDFDYTLTDGGQRNKLVLFQWIPDAAKIKQRMVYASSADAVKKALHGVHTVIQGSDLDDIEYDLVYDTVSHKGTK